MREEIDRKAFEQLELLAAQLEHGEISEAQFDTGVRAVWGCVSGLASNWIIDTISEIKDKRGDQSFKDTRILVKGEKMALVIRRYGGDKLILMLNGGSKLIDFSTRLNPKVAAMLMQKQAVEKLVAEGYRAI